MSEELEVTKDYIDPKKPIKENKDNGERDKEAAKKIRNLKQKINKQQKHLETHNKRINELEKKTKYLNNQDPALDKNPKAFLTKLQEELESLKTQVNEIKEKIDQDPKYSEYFDKLGRAKDFDPNRGKGNRTKNAYRLYRYLRKTAIKQNQTTTKKTKKTILKKATNKDEDIFNKIFLEYSGSNKAKHQALKRAINRLKELTKQDEVEGTFTTKQKRNKNYLILRLPKRATEKGR